MRVCQRKVKSQFKRVLSKGTLQNAVEESEYSRNQWSVCINERKREGGDPSYPFPPYSCLQREVTEKIEHHVSMHQYTCPVEEYRPGIGLELRRLRRVVDSTGLTEECVLFQTEVEPKNVKDLKRYEVRHGTRTTGISAKKEESDDEKETQEDNPQECESKKTNEDSETQAIQKPSVLPSVPAFYPNQNARSHDEDPSTNSGYHGINREKESD